MKPLVLIAALLTVTVMPLFAQGLHRADDVYCRSLAAEAMKPLPAPPDPPALESPQQDSGPNGMGALGQLAAAIAAMRGGLAAQSGYWQGTAEGNRERRERAYADWRARNEAAIANYELQRQAWLDRVAQTRALLERLDRDCLSESKR